MCRVKRETVLEIGLISLLVMAAYGGTMLAASGGRPVAPLDDAYIHFQYARQIARGHPWQYNDGDPLSTGATSPLYPFLLASGHLLGLRGEQMVWLALGLGTVNLALSAWLIHRITWHLTIPERKQDPGVGRWVPAGTALLFLLTGAIQWTFMSGMEGGLFTLLVLAALEACLRRKASHGSVSVWRPALWIALAALVRPEGLILASVLWLVMFGRYWRDRSLGREQAKLRSAPRRSKMLSLGVTEDVWVTGLAVLVGFAPLLLNLTLTGSPVATGAQAKSWVGNVPFRLSDIVESILGNYRRILEQFALGLLAHRSWYLAPGVLVLGGVGWMGLLSRKKWAELILTFGWFALGTLATASLITATWQVGRYQAPFLALLVPLAALGFVTLTSGLPRRWRWPVAGVIGLGLLGTTLVSTVQARILYQRAIRTVTEQHLAVADWVRVNLPSDALVAVHDTGAVRYVGGRPTYDMIGLTTQGAATAWRHGAGAVFERMERSQRQPSYFATYPDVFSIPYLAATDLFYTELFRAEVPDFAVASAGPIQAVYKANWGLRGSGKHLYQADVLRRSAGLALVDQLDVADLQDEAAHGLSFWEGVVRPGFPTEVQQLAYRSDPTRQVLDGGRLVNGGLSFRLATLPGQDLILVARLHPEQAGAVRVMVDGHDLGLWRYPALPGEWLETSFFVPGEVIISAESEVRLQVEAVEPSFRHFGLYFVWAWQGQPVQFSPTPSHPVSARLGNAIELLGYDQPANRLDDTYYPGEAIHLVLYWRAVVRPTEDAKVFVHLYDQSGAIVTQQDQRPYHGTRPPYTWWTGEGLDDPYTLELPPDLTPGRYTMALGMYDPITQIRLPVTVDADHHLPDNRILLKTVDVVPNTE